MKVAREGEQGGMRRRWLIRQTHGDGPALSDGLNRLEVTD
jgi:hypothetical protein